MWKHMNDSDNNDEMFFDDLFGSGEESDEVVLKVSADQSPTENKNEKTGETSSLVDKKKQQKYFKYPKEYVDHDLVNLELTTFKEGWIDKKGKRKKSKQKYMVDYRMELELLGGNAVEMAKKKKRQKKKKKCKKSAQKLAKDRRFIKKHSKLGVFPQLCHYFAEGKCLKGNDCIFSHLLPIKVKKLCKFYLNDECTLGKSCNYMHGEFPCKYYHTRNRCFAGEDCRFSHAPLTKEMEEALHAYLNPPRMAPTKPDPPVKRESILGVPPEELRQAEATVDWRVEMELLQDKDDKFFVEVPPIKEEKAKASILSSTCFRPKFYQDTLLDSPSPPASPQMDNLFTPLNFYGTSASKIRLGDSNYLPKLSHTLTSGEPSLVDINKPITQEVESAPEWIENVSPAINLALQSSNLQIQRSQIKEEPEKKVETKDHNETFPAINRVSAVEAEQASSVHDDECKNVMLESLPISPKTIDQEMTTSKECVESGRTARRTKCRPSQSSAVQIRSTQGMKRNCKLKESAELQTVNKKIKQSEELKMSSFIPRDNPNLILPKWPKLTDMLIEIDLQIMTKGNYSAKQINKRKQFHKKLLSTKYDSKKYIKSLPTDIRLMEPRPTPLRKLNLTNPVKEVELQGNSSLTLENDSSTSAGGKYLPSAKIYDQAKESINFTMNDGTSKPLKTLPNVKVECNKTPVYHPCVNYSENNKHREAKLPPTRELLLKYKTNQSSFSPNLLNESSAQDTVN